MQMLLRHFYNLILFIISPFFLFSLYKSKPNKPHFGSRWKEHFGCTPKLVPEFDKPIWIHAVSVGEVVAITPLIKRLKAQTPELDILLTTTTSTGANEAQKLAELITHRYMPLDFPFAIKAFIKQIQPKALFIMETELWPNTLFYCQKKRIPVTVVNARLSQRSADRYKKFPFIFNLLLKNINVVLAQTHQDAQRFIDLGVNKKQIDVTGSIKFDINVTGKQSTDAISLRQFIGIERKVWIAASTHKGEDEQILAAHKNLLKRIPDALLILVPRHPERFTSVQQLVITNKLPVVTRSSQLPVTEQTQVYLGDSMGEMMILLGAADICFIAGSLIGEKVGGHNLLEAAALNKPILNGPSYFNFKEITEQLIALGACQICENDQEITQSLQQLFDQPKRAKEQGKIALEFVQQNQGALQKTVENILTIIQQNKP